MNRHVAREAAVYGVAPGAATVATLGLIGYDVAGTTERTSFSSFRCTSLHSPP